MPAPHGVLTVYGDRIVSFKCDNESMEITTTNTCINTLAVMVVKAKKVTSIDLTVPE
jgi:membrane-bound inhibitor of C-type lysozyme